MTETLHMPILVPKLYLPTLTPAMVPNHYGPQLPPITTTATQLLILSASTNSTTTTQLLPLLLTPPLLLQLLLLLNLLIQLTPNKWNSRGLKNMVPLSGSSTYPKLGQKSVINGNKG